MVNIAFKITSKTNGEYHVVVTDANGEFKSASKWLKHTQNTNKNDSVLDKGGQPIVNDDGYIPSSSLDSAAGVWFGQDENYNQNNPKAGGRHADDVNDELGAFPYDTYIIDELPCENNVGKSLLHDIEFTVYRDDSEMESESIKLRMNNHNYYLVGTTAIDKGTNSHTTLAEEKSTVIDTVEYKGLIDGDDYTISGYAVDKATGEKIESIKEQEQTFQPKGDSGKLDMTYEFNSKELAGKTIVFYEYLYDRNDTLLASHEDLNDENQTIYIPKISTTATDKKTGKHTGIASNDVTIVDKVDYVGLIPGEKYTLEGELMYKKDGKSTKLVESITFTPKYETGSESIEFQFNASQIGGANLVVFETLYDVNHRIVAEHKDINDDDQSVSYPMISTNAVEKSTQFHIANGGRNAKAVI